MLPLYPVLLSYYFIMIFVPGDGVINGGDWFGAALIRWARIDVLFQRPLLSMFISIFDPNWNQEISLSSVYLLHFLNMLNPIYMGLSLTITAYLWPLSLYA